MHTMVRKRVAENAYLTGGWPAPARLGAVSWAELVKTPMLEDTAALQPVSDGCAVGCSERTRSVTSVCRRGTSSPVPVAYRWALLMSLATGIRQGGRPHALIPLIAASSSWQQPACLAVSEAVAV